MKPRFASAALGGVALFLAAAGFVHAQIPSQAWDRRYNGPANGNDYAVATALDAAGNVAVTGHSYNGNGNADYYTAMYAASDGSLLWEKRYNGPGNADDFANAMAIDAAGNVVVTGTSVGAGSGRDFYTAKYAAADGSLLWERRYNGPPGTFSDEARAVTLDGDGNVIVTGNAYTAISTTKYAASTGAVLWEKRINGPAKSQAVATDAAGNVFITGHAFNGTNQDMVTAKYRAADGLLLWERRYDGTRGDDIANALAVDAGGNAAITGSSSNGSNTDFYTVKYAAANGAVVWERWHNGPAGGNDVPNGAAFDSSGDLIVTGSVTTANAADFYTAKYRASDGGLLWDATYDGPAHSVDAAFGVVIEQNGDVFVTGHSAGDGGTSDLHTVRYAGVDGRVVWETRYDSGPGRQDVMDAVTPTAGKVAVGPRALVITGQSSTGGNWDYATVKYLEDYFPRATTLFANDITFESATLTGSVNPNGLAATAWFEYWKAGDPPTATAAQPAGGGNTGVAFSQAITGLDGRTAYFFRAMAANAEGAAQGDVQTFTTANTPPRVTGDFAFQTSGILTMDVLANDHDRDGQPLTISSVTQTAGGGVVRIEGGVIIFRAHGAVTTPLTFTYTATDGEDSTTATVTIYRDPPLRRTYVGHIFDTDGTTIRGLMRFNIYRTGGGFSGKIFIGGKNHTLRGSLGFGPAVVNVGATDALAGIPVTISAGTPDEFGDPQLEFSLPGEVDGTVWRGVAERTPFFRLSTGQQISPAVGRYTVLFEDGSGAPQPVVAGGAAVNVKAPGLALLAGKHANGRPMSTGTYMLSGGRALFYSGTLKGGAFQSLAGTLVFDGFADRDIGGSVLWTVPPGFDSRIPGGLSRAYGVLGSRYTPGRYRRTPATDMLAYNAAGTANFSFVLPSSGRIVDVVRPIGIAQWYKGLDPISLIKFSAGTGYFSGIFSDSTTPGAKFYGWVFQHPAQNRGNGSVIDTDRLGSMSLTPEQ